MKKVISLILALVLVLSLAACGSMPEETVPATEEVPSTTEATATAHTYDNDCDEICNDCGEVRTVADHTYANACDGDCDICGEKREVSEHQYDDDCDSRCNNCNEKRDTAHGGQLNEIGICANCGSYIGQSCEMNSQITVDFTGSQTQFVQVCAGMNMKQSIRFEGEQICDYAAYLFVNGVCTQVALSETPQALVSADYLYLVLTQKDEVQSVTFQIEENP